MNSHPRSGIFGPSSAATGLALALLTVIFFGCSTGAAAGSDARSGDGDGDGDADAAPGTPDATRSPADACTAAAAADPGPVPSSTLLPKPGELTIQLAHLAPGITVRLAEATVIVGPDGTLVLLDIGNSPHDDDVRDLVRYLNTEVLTSARGFPQRQPLQVEWVILTHYHGDHIGAFHKLFINTREPLQLVHKVVHRGMVDLGDGMNTNDYQELCSGLKDPSGPPSLALCQSAKQASCVYRDLEDPHVATACDGLLRGDLADPSDDSARLPSRIELGGGASITLTAVNGYASNGTEVIAMPSFGHESGGEENARSIAGLLSYGSFRYHFGGDMHGRSDDGPDVEAHLVRVAAPLYGELGVDVVHAHHHARRTSSNSTFVAAMAPDDGRDRNVVAGFNEAHLGSPYSEVLEAWTQGERLKEGAVWVPLVTVGGARSDRLVESGGGDVMVQTYGKGRGYWLQSVANTLTSRSYRSVRDGDCGEAR